MPGLTLDEIFEEAGAVRARMRRERPQEPRAVGARYDASTNRVLVELNNGCVFGFPVWMVPGTSRATPQELENVSVQAHGEAIAWEELNADTNVNGLILEVLHVRDWAARYLGSLTSPAKSAAARENGKKGGRPKKRANGE
ncbi:MAG: DUF2442 domain-containing protein [Gemmatimonadetes bacterium]|nr:DUF2442 domain-containing protein [Gemmatimonadota bacterium]